LKDGELVSYFWPAQPANGRLHVFVKLASGGESCFRYFVRQMLTIQSYLWATRHCLHRMNMLSPSEPLERPPKRSHSGNDTEIQVKKPKANGDSSQCEQVSLSSPLTTEETEASMVPALEGFENYIISLATGKLDGYLDSFRGEDQATISGVDLPLGPGPNLLLHDLGQNYIGSLSYCRTVFVMSGQLGEQLTLMLL